MAFDPKQYKLDVASPIRLYDTLSLEELRSVLKYWSRLGNQRAKRMMEREKGKETYSSALIEYRKGGEFGSDSGKYLNKETIYNELNRISRVGGRLKAKDIDKEQREATRILKKLNSGIKAPENAISDEDFRRGFAMYQDKFGNTYNDVYAKLKDLVQQYTERSLYGVYDIIVREVARLEDETDNTRIEPLKPPESFGHTDNL